MPTGARNRAAGCASRTSGAGATGSARAIASWSVRNAKVGPALAHRSGDAPDAVEAVFRSYPREVRGRVRELRDLIFGTAASIDAVGPLTETLKWGEPAYLTERSRSGSTIRIGWKAASPNRYALYFNCQTDLVDTFRTLFPELRCEGNRAVIFDVDEPLPADCVSRCIELALTYHITRKRRRGRK